MEPASPPAPGFAACWSTATRWWCGTAPSKKRARWWAISTKDIRPYSLEALTAALQPGDIAVSMLPADQHVSIAKACLAKGANFVSSSYIAPEMRALDAEFKAKGLVSVNEVGLDPGIDHLMAHELVARYRASKAYDAANVVSFTSYCGGVPKIANPFRYKFSWAPVGVLKALRSPSRSLRDFKEFKVDRPWNAITIVQRTPADA